MIGGPPSPRMMPAIVEWVTTAMLYYLREHADAATKQPFIEILRSLIQCVAIGPSPDGKGAELTVHGRIVGILATMDAVKAMEAMEAEHRTLGEYEYPDFAHRGLFDTQHKRDEFLRRCAEELAEKRLE